MALCAAVAVSSQVAIILLLQTRTCGELLRADTAAVARLSDGFGGIKRGE